MLPVVQGVIFHWLGGLASGSFYVPYKAVRKWSWEVYWLAGGFFSWIIAPWVLGFCLTNDLVPTITEAWRTNPDAVKHAYMFGALWGIGGLTFGLTMRYLGMSLGMAVALGLCTVLGTVLPDVYNQSILQHIKSEPPYVVILLGLGVCLLGVILAGVAGASKEREMSEDVKKASIKEFSFFKGIFVALISGLFSACMAFGLQAAEPVATISIAHGTEKLWSGLPKLCVVLLGGFTTNFVWCLLLLLKTGTLYQFFTRTIDDPDNPGEKVKICYLWNLFFSALAGTTWYFQFFFYSMGETKMGEYQFSSWTLHMASIIIFSSLWGLALREWKGSSKFTKFILGVAIFTLLYSTITVGYGNLMKQQAPAAEPAAASTTLDPTTDATQDAIEAATNAISNAVEKTAEAVETATEAAADAISNAAENAVE